MGSCNIIHDERSEECIIHEPIVYYELTILIHGFGALILNKRDLCSIDLVEFFLGSGSSISFLFCLIVE